MSARRISDTRLSALLTEYEVAHEHANKFDNAIWNTASVFLPISLAGLVFIPQAGSFSIPRFFTVAAIGLGSIIILSGWIGMVNRWDAYKRVVFVRLREIEKELGFWHNRYLQHMYVTRILKDKEIEVGAEKDKSRFQELDTSFTKFPGVSTATLLKRVAGGLIITWISLMVVEFVFTFLVQ
jgi:hypothetical protein